MKYFLCFPSLHLIMQMITSRYTGLKRSGIRGPVITGWSKSISVTEQLTIYCRDIVCFQTAEVGSCSLESFFFWIMWKGPTPLLIYSSWFQSQWVALPSWPAPLVPSHSILSSFLFCCLGNQASFGLLFSQVGSLAGGVLPLGSPWDLAWCWSGLFANCSSLAAHALAPAWHSLVLMLSYTRTGFISLGFILSFPW